MKAIPRKLHVVDLLERHGIPVRNQLENFYMNVETIV